MNVRLGRPLVALASAALIALSLGACATPNASTDPGADRATEEPSGSAVLSAAWLDGGRSIGVVTEGSSTCVPETQGVALTADGALEVTFAELDEATPCMMDLAPRVSFVELPAGIDPSVDLEISVSGAGVDGTTTLSGVDGLAPSAELMEAPSAGWTDLDGAFVVLLWGSSTCEEYLTSTEVTGAAAVTASLSGIPADKVCTADMAPNPVLGFADGLQGVEDVELTLTGSMDDDVTIPIVGVNTPAG